MSERVQVFEVGPRDGIQNEKLLLRFSDKVWLINSLIQAGIKDLELGAFVRPDRVPQMADTDRIYHAIQSRTIQLGSARPWALVPNRKGLERALQAGVTHIAIFTAGTESFAKNNIGMTIRESLTEFRSLIQDARMVLGAKLKVRGYVSTAFGCPFEGRVTSKKALRVIEKLADLEIDQISIGDTIGVANPNSVTELLKPALRHFGKELLAVHFHDTRGTALANALRSIDLGIRVIDSSAGGLGGCPFAPGASGNLSTEDLVYMLNGMKIKTGINLELLCKTSLELSRRMNRPLTSRYLQSFASKC